MADRKIGDFFAQIDTICCAIYNLFTLFCTITIVIYLLI